MSWAEDGHNDDTIIALLTSEKKKEIEQSFALAPILHDRTVDRVEVMCAHVDGEGSKGRPFLMDFE